MQEMSENWINFWMNCLDLAKVKSFYSLNYFFQPLSYLAEGANTMAPWLSSQWVIQSQRYNPFWIRAHTIRNYLQLFSVKKQSSPNFLNHPSAFTQNQLQDIELIYEKLKNIRAQGTEGLL